LTGAKIKTKDQKEKMKNISKAFDVDLFYQLGVNFNVVWSSRTSKLAEGSFEELKEDFPFKSIKLIFVSDGDYRNLMEDLI
jgi:hypothetical protein